MQSRGIELFGRPASRRDFTNAFLVTAAGWRRYRLATFSRVSRRLLRFIDTIADDEFSIRAFAVDSTHRGTGIGKLLTRRLEEAARATGSARLAFDVAARNHRARRRYEHLGMTAACESPKWFGLPATNVTRMTKPL